MGWVRDGLWGEHEGYPAYVTDDGRLSGTTVSKGVLVRNPDVDEASAARWEDLHDLVTWERVVAWQTVCACGWIGSRWNRADIATPDPNGEPAPEEALLADGRTVAEAANADWRVHVAPFDRLAAVQEAASAAAAARRRLDDAVAAARADGASWTDIGRATGISRQSAHERWGTRTADRRGTNDDTEA